MNMNDSKELSQEQDKQERDYAFPYHYIPHWKDGNLSLVRYWGMSSLPYLGRIELIKQLLHGQSFASLIDVGCGDGRLLRELAQEFSNKQLIGVDYSLQAINLAQAFNPHLNYMQLDITVANELQQYDVVTLVEVLEHIPFAEVDDFVEALKGLVSEGGMLILTVPHQNVPLPQRHFQHFTKESLEVLLARYFQQIDIQYINASSRWFRILQRLLGGRGRYYLLTYAPILNRFFSYYLQHYVRAKDEKNCQGLLAVCRL